MVIDRIPNAYSFRYRLRPSWPPLAWVAKCTPGQKTVQVEHGPAVEVRDAWWCEAVWDGTFEAGQFDATDIVFGSGARLRSDGLRFVSSCAPVDRLQFVQSRGAYYISNSLVALHAVCGMGPDVTNSAYYRDFKQIVDGALIHDIPTTGPDVRLVYVHNVRWNGETLDVVEKPRANRRLDTFAAYRAFLEEAAHKLVANLGAPERTVPFRMMGTLSSGYDTTAVCSLLAPHGLDEAITITSARGGAPDTGDAAAHHLGIRLHHRARSAWTRGERPEVPFMAADAKGEDIFFCGAKDQLIHRVLFTGHPGGSIWGKNCYTGRRRLYARGDRSGVSLTEFRLWCAFVHVPVPFLGFEQRKAIAQISTATEMAAWDVGGDYSRPIPRRIAEEAGVPRDAFGTQKKAASVLFHEPHLSPWRVLSRSSYIDFLQWCWGRSPFDDFPLRRRDLVLLVGRQLTLGLAARSATALLQGMGAMQGRWTRGVKRLYRAGGDETLRGLLYAWAMEHAISRYDDEPVDPEGNP